MYVLHRPLGQIPHRALTRSVSMLRRIVQKMGLRRGRNERVWSDIVCAKRRSAASDPDLG